MMKETKENVTSGQTPPEELPCRGQHLPGVQPRQSASVCVTQPPRAHQVLLTTQYQQVQGVPKTGSFVTAMRKEKIG